MLQSSPAQSPGLRGFSSFSHLDLSSSHSDPGLVADAPEQSPPLQGKAEIFFVLRSKIHHHSFLSTLLRASNSGSRTYFINPICAIGLVTRSLQIKWLFSTKLFSQKYFTCPWTEPRVNCLSFPCQTAENTLPSNIQPSPVVEEIFKSLELQRHVHLWHHDWSTLIGDVAGLDQDHLQRVEVILGAVVKVVQFLLEVVEYLGVASHVRGEDQNNHILDTRKLFKHNTNQEHSPREFPWTPPQTDLQRCYTPENWGSWMKLRSDDSLAETCHCIWDYFVNLIN